MDPLASLDHLLRRALTRSWREAEIDPRLSTSSGDGPDLETIYADLAAIDTKANALLAYTSLMVAALGLASTAIAETKGQQAVIVVGIMLYLLISLLCLRTVSLFRRHGSGDTARNSTLFDEMILRQSLYRFCNRATIYVTMLVIVSFPVLLAL